MKVLVADPFEASGLDGLRAAGCEVVHDAGLKDEALVAALAETGADVLIVRSTKVTAEMLDAGALGLIVRAGAGYNTIDVAAASARGIYVSNCPGKNAVAVAELTMGLILALDRRIPDNVIELRAGRWNKKEYASGPGPGRLDARACSASGASPRTSRGGRRASGCISSSGRAGSPSSRDVDFAAYGLDSGREARRSRSRRRPATSPPSPTS